MFDLLGLDMDTIDRLRRDLTLVRERLARHEGEAQRSPAPPGANDVAS
jgi:hypothetical protein